jgi:RNA methyltransferase, TrmH family
MGLDIEQLCEEFSHLKLVGSKDNSIRLINRLIKNKKVEDEDLFVIEGLWAYEKIIKSNIRIINFVFCLEFIKNKSILDMVKSISMVAENSCLMSSNLCKRLSSRDSGEGFFLLCSFPQHGLGDIKLKDNNLLVVLDGLEKPGNIGTIIRSVDGAGGDGVIICNSKVRKTNHKLIKSSMGSSFMLPVVNSDIELIVRWLKSNGFKIIVTDLKATKNYYNVDYKGRIAIIAGNEIHGISNIWNSHECERVIIPMFGGADSLNVGVATTIVVYEASICQKNLGKRVG